MNIIVETQARTDDAQSLRATSLARLQFALRRLRSSVDGARISLTDTNGPRGGVDKHCQVQLHLQPGGTVLVNARADNWRSALEQAIQRVVQLVLRRLKQVRRPRRPQLRRLPVPAAD